MKKHTLVLPTLVAATGIAVAGIGLVSADTTSTTASDSSSSTSQSSRPEQPPKDADGGPQKKDGGVIVTDESVISSATATVTAKYSGATVDRIAKLPDGSYLAFSRKSDDSKVIVSLDSSFAVTSAKELPAGAPKDGQPPKDDTTES